MSKSVCKLVFSMFFQLAHNVQYKKRRAGDEHYRFGLLLS